MLKKPPTAPPTAPVTPAMSSHLMNDRMRSHMSFASFFARSGISVSPEKYCEIK
jgi:hypothetical protein